MTSDLELLQDYARNRSEESFTALVNRHLNLVYSAALRQVRSPQLAEEVAQAVFMDLAQNAGKLRPDTILTAWLYLVTRRTAIDVVRRESRRQLREQIASEMNAMNATATDWMHVEPLLDDAMAALEETDRAAVLLRYFENKSLREVGATLGTSDDAAQKRVSRAVERLREFLAKRGIAVGAGGLVAVVSANAVQAAPAGLALTISTAATLAGASATAAATVTTAKLVAMTTLQKALVAATVTVLAGAGIYEASQASRRRGEVASLQQQQAPLAEQIAALRTENRRLSSQIVSIQEATALSQAQRRELSKLRRETPTAQIDAGELARLKATLAEQDGKMPDYFTNLMAAAIPAIEKQGKKEALAQLARMKGKLNLAPDQELAVSNILLRRIERQIQRMLDSMSRRPAPEERMQAPNDDPDAEIKALLSPEQLAAYPEYLQQKMRLEADNSAQFEVERLTFDLRLSDQQEVKLKQKLSELKVQEKSSPPSWEPIAEAVRNGRRDEAIQIAFEREQSRLERTVKALGDILTPEQIKVYREEELKMIDIDIAAMKLELSQPTAK